MTKILLRDRPLPQCIIVKGPEIVDMKNNNNEVMIREIYVDKLTKETKFRYGRIYD